LAKRSSVVSGVSHFVVVFLYFAFFLFLPLKDNVVVLVAQCVTFCGNLAKRSSVVSGVSHFVGGFLYFVFVFVFAFEGQRGGTRSTNPPRSVVSGVSHFVGGFLYFVFVFVFAFEGQRGGTRSTNPPRSGGFVRRGCVYIYVSMYCFSGGAGCGYRLGILFMGLSKR